MTTAPTETATPFDELDRDLAAGGPSAVFDRLIAGLEARGEYRALLDAMLLKIRHELGLPPVLTGPLSALPEPARSAYEDRYVSAIRAIGGKILASGDVLNAWPYYRVIGEKEPIVAALDAAEPEPGDERVGAFIDVAFQQGAHPLRGFRWILDHYGTCSAISSFDGLPPEAPARAKAVEWLVERLHEHLEINLRDEIARRGQPAPAPGVPLRTLVAGRPWLFADDAYHIDVSHLASVVRMTPLLESPEIIERAIGLTDYGRALAPMHRYEGDPPFHKLYEDHAVYLNAVLGRGADAALAHFRDKLGADGDPAADAAIAQVLVRLLDRLGRDDEAIAVAAEYLADAPESLLTCPSLPQLCQKARRADRLADSARARGDLVAYATALVLGQPTG